MIHTVRTTLNPGCYHGHRRQPPFFEGWYYKLVDASQKNRVAIIPGIFLSEDPDKHHAFVQYLDGQTGYSTYHRYPADEFWAADGEFDLRIGPNRFTAEQLTLAISSEEITIRGQLGFEGITPWPVSLISPGIMGWYAWVPFMECYHGVVSLDHAIKGVLEVQNRSIDMSGGRGYIEKDWGRSFPSAWIWFQTNHFAQPGTSLTASVANIPWLRGSFPGFIIGLWLDGKLYRFATYTGARIAALEIDDERVIWTVHDKRHRLEMQAVRARGGLINAPTTGDMGRRIAETLDATVDVRLLATGHGQERVVFEGTGRHAGLEAVGDLAHLRTTLAP
ncbi:MAG: tocopherol cyclase family protein [Anaerolineae bacterium]